MKFDDVSHPVLLGGGQKVFLKKWPARILQELKIYGRVVKVDIIRL